MLKGKAKIDFEQWYPQFYAHNLPNKNRYEEDFEKDPNWKRLAITIFYSKIPQEQQGVIREFFESKGIWVVVRPQFEVGLPLSCEFYYKVYSQIKTIESGLFPDYNTAFNEAINKANEIYNGKEF